jgi:membrane protein
MPRRHWRTAAIRALRTMRGARASLAASGCAFWATLALFPALSMLVLIYGLLLDPRTVLPQLDLLRGVVPEAARALIVQSVQQLLHEKHTILGRGLVISTLVTLWGAATGARALITALNLAYREHERRSYLRFQLVALLLTLGGLAAVALAIAVIVLLPAGLSVAAEFGLGASMASRLLIARVVGHVVLALAVPMLLAALYRYAPSRRHARWAWVLPGALVAGVIWFLASLTFSAYLGTIARQGVTYGPIGAVAGVMLWLWVTTYAVLLGAELNAALELQSAEDTCIGPPRPVGSRGAVVADSLDTA